MLYDVFMMVRNDVSHVRGRTPVSVEISPVLVRQISAKDEQEALKKAKAGYITPIQLAVQKARTSYHA